jgi:predicted anti-sigma-YlaC factor YlaD
MRVTDKNCASVQELLLKKDFADLTEHESLMLTEHLQQCESCRALEQVLLKMQQAMQPVADEILVPNPAIRQDLRNRIRRTQPARHTSNGLREVWIAFRDILRLRIPVYQAVLGAAVVFVVFIGIDQLNAHGERETLRRLLSEQNGQRAIVHSEVPHRIAQIDSQKIGRSVAEDSLLMKFIVTAM